MFDRSAYVQMMDDVENGKVGIVIMKDMTRWGRDYLQVGNAMEVFRRNNVRFIAINNGIDSAEPSTLEFAPFINIMSEWYARDISKKVKTGIKTKGTSAKPIATEAPYGYVKAPNNKDFWLIDEEAAEVVRLIFRLFMDGKNRNQIAIYLKNEQILTPTFYLKQHERGTAKSKPLNEENRYNWNKATLTHILTRQEYCGDVVNFKTAKHYRDKHSSYVDKSQWQITENVHEPIIDRATFENVQRILADVPVKRPNGDGYIHPLSGLLYCKDCGTKMHIRTIRKSGGNQYVTYCSEYAKGKAKHPKCHSPHRIDVDIVMQNIAEVLRKIAQYSLADKAGFEALVKNSLAKGQTDEMKKQQKRISQITHRLEQIEKVMDKLYEDNALGAIEPDRYEQLSQKYAKEYYPLKKELEEIRARLYDHENQSQRAKKLIRLVESYCDFEEVTPTVHLGVAAFQMEKRGIRTERGDLNREIEVTNQRLRQLKARIGKLRDWLKEEATNTEPPTLADYIQDILRRKAQAGKSGYSQSLYNLKDAANMLNFLTANNIMDMAGLDEKFSSMIGEQMDIQDKLKPIERRLATLKKHIGQVDIYMKYKGKKALPNTEQALFAAAHSYLKDVMNGKTTLPTKAWKAEYAKLTAERKTLNQRYLVLKDEVKKAEQIRKSVYSILRQEQRERQPHRGWDVEH